MTLNHVHLGTKNLDEFIAFYSRYFGFLKKFDHGNGAFLTNESGFLIAVDPVSDLPELPDWYHLGFCLDDEKQVFDLYARMNMGGEKIVRDMKAESGSYASFFVLDPDNNKLEVSWHDE